MRRTKIDCRETETDPDTERKRDGERRREAKIELFQSNDIVRILNQVYRQVHISPLSLSLKPKKVFAPSGTPEPTRLVKFSRAIRDRVP